MDSEDDYDDILPEARIFDNRIDDIYNEKMEAYEDFYSKQEKEIEESETNKMIKEVLTKKQEKAKQTKKGRARGKKKAEATLDEAESPTKILRRSTRAKCSDNLVSTPEKDESFSSEILLSATTKKKLKKLQQQTERENRRVEKQTREILSSYQIKNTVDVEVVDEDIPEQEVILKIRYKSKLLRLTVGENEEFHSIFKKVGDLVDLKPSDILLCLGEKNISLMDTPASLNLKVFHIIDCIPYTAEEISTNDNCNKLLIKIQSNDTRKKTEMSIHKLEKFEDIMKKYAELRKIPLKDLVFEFDGEKIEETDTPSDLDMESGSCIDVRVLSFKQPVSKKQTEKFVNIAPSEMLDICVLD